MEADVGVAHLAPRERHAWPSRSSTEAAGARVIDSAIFACLPSLALEEILYHHLLGEALRAVAAALADENNKDDDATDVVVLCTWLASAHAPLHGSPEFWCAARRLKSVWARLVRERFGVKDFGWRGVSPWPRSAGGSVTMVCGPRCRGKTTAALRLARVLVARVSHVVCVTANPDERISDAFSGLGIDNYELGTTIGNHLLDAFDIDRMWQTIGALVRAYAREGVLLFIDGMYWSMVANTSLLVKEIRDLGVHLAITHQGFVPPGDLMAHLDRIVWACKGPHDAQRQGPLHKLCAEAGADPLALAVAGREHSGDANGWNMFAYQRRCDGACDVQVMPFAPLCRRRGPLLDTL
ncbi:Aaa Atpase domain-containing protein [Pandoravirus kuranda]|uniref:Aaa Atpase domain-containing protein n=1 Tax=Pandoravirus kuranda TaxID=3019033 RepID=A0AA95EFG3_9VIRU|nr:Aaa Atpase domain-containing protein [Pandoravirus kuranda]